MILILLVVLLLSMVNEPELNKHKVVKFKLHLVFSCFMGGV